MLPEAYEWSFDTQVPEISYVQIGSDWVYPPKNSITTPDFDFTGNANQFSSTYE